MNRGLTLLNGLEPQPRALPTGSSSIISVLQAQKTAFKLGWQYGTGHTHRQRQGVTTLDLITSEISIGLMSFHRLQTSFKGYRILDVKAYNCENGGDALVSVVSVKDPRWEGCLIIDRENIAGTHH